MIELSKMRVSSVGKLLWEEKPFSTRKLTFFYLDDHTCFQKAVYNHSIFPYFPTAEMMYETNGDKALKKLKKTIDEQNPPNVLITDIIHPGLKGDDFIRQLRQYEQQAGVQRMPLIIVTFIMEQIRNHFHKNKEDLVDVYFDKSASAEDIVNGIFSILL